MTDEPIGSNWAGETLTVALLSASMVPSRLWLTMGFPQAWMHVLLASVVIPSNPFVHSFGIARVAAGATFGSAAFMASQVKVVSTGNECLVERFGKFRRKLGPGWHLVWNPFEKVSFEETTREQLLDIPPQPCFTLDNVPIKTDAVVFLWIYDTVKAKYEVADVKEALHNLCLTQVREQVGKLTLDQTFSSRVQLNQALLTDLNEVCQAWGVQISRVEIQGLQPNKEVVVAMERQLAAERSKRASILQSEGERMTQINQAEGKAEALLIEEKARAKGLTLKVEAEADKVRKEAAALKEAIATVCEST